MNKVIGSIVLTLIISCLIFGQTKQANEQSAAKEIAALEQAWNDAAQKYDIAWFERHIADSYLGTDESGLVIDKATLLSNVKTTHIKTNLLHWEA
jgi:hypothetical protein